MTTPNLDADAPCEPSDDDLNASLRCARDELTLRSRTRTLCLQLQQDWESYRKARLADADTGSSPVNTLKLEAMAAIAALADFHCCAAHNLNDEGDDEAAHSWSLDEGMLRSAYVLLANIDTETL